MQHKKNSVRAFEMRCGFATTPKLTDSLCSVR